MQRTALPSQQNRAFADGVGVAHLVIDVRSLPGEVCDYKLRRSDTLQDDIGDSVIVLNVVGAAALNIELAANLFNRLEEMSRTLITNKSLNCVGVFTLKSSGSPGDAAPHEKLNTSIQPSCAASLLSP